MLNVTQHHAADCVHCSLRAWPPIVSKIMELYKGHLSSPGSIRDMSALLLGRLLTRPDLQPALEAFLAWARTALHSDSPQAHFLVPGQRMKHERAVSSRAPGDSSIARHCLGL